MGMFDYRGHDASAQIADAYTIATSTTLKGYGISTAVSAGWRPLTAAELNVSSSRVDTIGDFKGESVLGSVEGAAQAQVFGKFDASDNLTSLAFSIAGTNTQADKAEWFKIVDGTYMHNFDYLLDAVAAYATGHGLTGADVAVTGYSLGGGAVNNMYALKDSAWAGFYANSDYIAFAGFDIQDGPGIFNFGYQNDVIYRLSLDSPIVDWNKLATDPNYEPALPGLDQPIASGTDNIILYDTIYNAGYDANFTSLNPVKHYGFQLDNILSWSAHLSGIMDNQVERIASSTYYNLIGKDSYVVLAQYQDDALKTHEFPGWDFSAMNPPANAWVHNRDANVSSFLIGSTAADWFEDGNRDDHIDAQGGDDLIRLSKGHDIVSGGGGTDTVFLLGFWSNYTAYKLNDGTIVMNDATLTYGAKEMTGVEKILAEGLSHTNTNSTWAVPVSSLTYAAHSDGTAGNDTLNGTSGADVIFGLDGNDTIYGGAGNDTIYGGRGNDIIDAGTGQNIIVGGEGDDTLMLSGNRSLYTITQSGSTLKLVASGITNYVSDIEHLHFADQTIHVADQWPIL